MEAASNPREQYCDPVEAAQNGSPLSSIIMHNVRDLNITGLTNLCSNYGTVLNINKHSTNPNIAFIEFATESDATMAIQNLNSKLGFGYRAQFVYPKNNVREKMDKKQNVQQIQHEDWEEESMKRRFNFSLMPPLSIDFPEVEHLGSKANYMSRITGPLLRMVDPELYFYIQKVLPQHNDGRKKSIERTEPQNRFNACLKAATGGSFEPDKNEFKYAGLSEKKLATFGAIQFCAVCGGYGFVYCSNCSTYYCSTLHQRQHYTEHKSACTGAGESKDGQSVQVPLAKRCGSSIPAARSNVLKRSQLPNKASVFITTVLTHDCVFVRAADPTQEREYLQTLADCERASLAAKSVTLTKPTVGEIYLSPGAPHGSCGRVLLVEVGAEKSKCIFIEHGVLSFVKNDSLTPIDDQDLKYRTVYVYRVCLADITDEFGQRESAMEYLNKLKKQCLEMTHSMEAGNMVNVQLRTGKGVSVNETLNRLIIIPPIVSEEDHKKYIMYRDIPLSYPRLGQSKSITILNRTTIQFDGRVNWIATEDLPYLETLQNKLQNYGKKVSDFQQFFTPRIGELCLARCLDRWYRAVCHETAGDCKPALFLCDYGCMMLVDLLNIRKIPAQFATEVRTHDGVVKGFLGAKKLPSMANSSFLDIHLPENEPLLADISVLTKQESLLNTDEPEVYNILNMHLYSDFLESLSK